MLKVGFIMYHVKFGKDRSKRTQLDLVTGGLFGFGVCQVQSVDLIIYFSWWNIVIIITRKIDRYLR